MTNSKMIFAIISSAIFIAVVFVISGASYYNREVNLRTLHGAQEDVNRIIFEKFQKTIVEKAGVVQASVEAQKELFSMIMGSKSGKGEALVKFVQEHNPNPDQALTETSQQFRDIMVSIEGLRGEFSNAQIKSRDIEREHAGLINGFWSRKMLVLFGANIEPLKTRIITSTDTEDVFATGKDDTPIDPFNKLKK